MLNEYIPLIVAVLAAVGVAVIFFAAGNILGPKKKTVGKMRTYESGMLPFGNARKRFSVKFYLTAISFIVFDVEALFLYPWAVNLTKSPSLAFFWCGVIFVFILLIGYFWELRKGGFEWDS
jgi:NADH-quinone oxidoreductase subunit A